MKAVPPGLLKAIHVKTVIPQGVGKDEFIIRFIKESIERTMATFKTLDDCGVFTAEDRTCCTVSCDAIRSSPKKMVKE